MKRMGLLAMALVLALGIMGIGYAMWSDTVSISGNVTTGSVDIDIDDTSDTYVYKVVQAYPSHAVGEMVCSNTTQNLNPDGDNVTNLLLVASAVTVDKSNPNGDVDEVTMTFTNIFPTDNTCLIKADVLMHYLGTIPAHVVMSDPDWSGGTDNLSEYLEMEWRYSEDDGTTWAVICDPELLQLHECDLLWLDVWFNPDLLQSNGIAAQGLSGQFSFTLMAHQWNETP